MAPSDSSDHPLRRSSISDPPADYLRSIGEIDAIFERTQDSGNASFGVRVGGERFFVKTAGDPGRDLPLSPFPARVALLRNAAALARSCSHRLLPRFFGAIESPAGPMLVYAWVEGELLHERSERRANPDSAFARFRALPAETVLRALDLVYDLHRALAGVGWIEHDFYDGSLIYDFERDRTQVIDLDNYQPGPFVNEMGRMFGSKRFMAPEKFERGARIDEATSVFTLGRAAAVLAGERSAFRGSATCARVIERACASDRGSRFPTVAEFVAAWETARQRG